MIRGVLTEADFQKLVAGKAITLTDLVSDHRGSEIKLILEDIGFDRMRAAIDDAERPTRLIDILVPRKE